MNLSAISAVPEINTANVLHDAYKTKLLLSLDKLVSYVANVLGEDYSAILDKMRALQDNLPKFISPRVYCLYFDLLTAINQDDIAKVKASISVLENMDRKSYIKLERTIQPGLIEDWEQQVFIDEVIIAFGDDKLMATMLHDDAVKQVQDCINHTLSLIATADPIFFTEINSFVASILLVDSAVNVGATSPKFFGSMYVSLPQENFKKHQTLFFAEHLVHETSHMYLNAIIPHDPLVLNDADERFDSPIRLDLRPMLGVYHAAFVLSRVIRVFKKINDLNLYADTGLVNFCVRNLIEKFEIAYETVMTNGVLTAVGKNIMESTRACALLKP